MKLVSLTEAKQRILVDHDDEDVDIELCIEAASEAVFTYLKDGVAPFVDSSGQPIEDSTGVVVAVPAAVKIATLYLVAIFYKDRDENPQEIFRQGFLPKPVTALLFPYRDPTVK